ncbi:NAD(P)H-dependent oxidoreductase [Galbibacter pacificus]|uniref:NAD(P)H-dependent oxidoreductase n=1 Tax=Galbibacter pacificus TaxID=2996052 RepID=A0ABT6FRJ6_9FLAO|nr:NAD(P)H-dependent oxidoreductase [Galbibacter pacificus]MDG3582997.1 NAD(P)H-dependent oxidoreductase [Galbibacter pacificus]MDG3585884.1 NAD(P)H-dependent oxidoreductase [Galbibacter pacificus]
MKKVFIINGGQTFGNSKGEFNKTMVDLAATYFAEEKGYEVKVTDINQAYNAAAETKKFIWADIIVYHLPIWWFQVPHKLKEYFDYVFKNGQVYNNDGRSSKNPAINYGTGGLLKGRTYMVNTSWNAPNEAFTLPGEFFNETSVDKGVLFGFHRMNAFLDMEPLPGIHFYDVVKNNNVEGEKVKYKAHLDAVFATKDKRIAL